MDEKVVERFFKFVDSNWKWIGHKNKDGYGRLRANGKRVFSHRVSYEIHYGKIPKGLQVLHSCDNPACVNPKHLHLGTPADNMREKAERGRSTQGEKNSHARLTNEQVIEIRNKYKNGMTQKDICKQYNLISSHVSKIVNRERWKHI